MVNRYTILYIKFPMAYWHWHRETNFAVLSIFLFFTTSKPVRPTGEFQGNGSWILGDPSLGEINLNPGL